MIRIILFSFICLAFCFNSIERKGKISRELKEISGWVFVNDSTLVAHNDSGNAPILYVLNLNGSIRHRTTLLGVKNMDMEDITTDDKGHLYIGDFGNNTNMRKDLVIYKVKTAKVLELDEVEVKSIRFSYPEQASFPPVASDMHYDAEAMAYYKDSLYIFTKCRAEPFDGSSLVYCLPTTAGNYKAKKKQTLVIGKRDSYRDAVTAADVYKDELYLTTYNRLIIYKITKGEASFKTQISMLPISQKEAVAVKSSTIVYITDEYQKVIGGGTIFVVNPKKKGK